MENYSEKERPYIREFFEFFQLKQIPPSHKIDFSSTSSSFVVTVYI